MFTSTDCYAEKQMLSWPRTMAGDSTVSIEICPQYSAKGNAFILMYHCD